MGKERFSVVGCMRRIGKTRASINGARKELDALEREVDGLEEMVTQLRARPQKGSLVAEIEEQMRKRKGK